MTMTMRKTADCRMMPSESGCSLTISGAEDEVVKAAAEHAASVHGHENTEQTRREIRGMLEDDGPAGRYGTVMTATLTGSFTALQEAAEQWVEQRRVDGFLDEEVMLAKDGRTVVVTVFFRDQAAYDALADDPDQDRWWTERMAPHLTDVTWLDGTWQHRLSHLPAEPAHA
jgi:hypothetical protein